MCDKNNQTFHSWDQIFHNSEEKHNDNNNAEIYSMTSQHGGELLYDVTTWQKLLDGVTLR